MILYLNIIDNEDVTHSFGFLNNCESSRIHYPNEFVIYLKKFHDHYYSCRAFFYGTLFIYDFSCNSKYKLYRAVQKMLKDELYDVVQF